MIATALKVGASACALFAAYAFGHTRGFNDAVTKTTTALRESALGLLYSTRADYVSRLINHQTDLNICRAGTDKFHGMSDELRGHEEERLVSTIKEIEEMIASLDDKIMDLRAQS